jgi:hypothetical protein
MKYLMNLGMTFGGGLLVVLAVIATMEQMMLRH